MAYRRMLFGILWDSFDSAPALYSCHVEIRDDASSTRPLRGRSPLLAAYLKHLSRADNPAYKQELTRLNDEFSQGKVFTMEQVQRLHENLSNEGL